MNAKRTTLLAFASLFVAAQASASSSHFFELQFSTAELAQIVRGRLMTSGQFCPVDIPCPGAAGQCVVDHIEYPSAGTMSLGPSQAVQINDQLTLNGPQPRLQIPIVAHVRETACAYDPNCTDPAQTFFTTLNLAVHVGSGDQLCFSPDGLGIPVPVPLPTQAYCVDLDVSAMQALTGPNAGTVSGRAVALNVAGTRLGVRFELGRTPAEYNATRVAAWQSFVNGTLASGFSNLDWSSFVHHTLITEGFSHRLLSGVAQSPDLALLGTPSVTWTGLGANGGQVDLSVGAEYDSCVDISPLQIQAFVRKNLANTGFDLFGSVGWDANAWDTFWCGFQQAGPFGAIAGPIIASTVDLTDVGGIGGGCIVTSESGFSCAETTHPIVLSLGGGWTLHVELSDVAGLVDGLAMGGATVIDGMAPPYAQVSLQTPSFGLRGSCSSGRCGYEGGVFVQGNARLCGHVQLAGDPLGVYEITPPDDLILPAAYKVEIRGGLPASVYDAFKNASYGPTVIVRSSVGIRAYQMDAPTMKDRNDVTSNCSLLQVKYRAERCMIPKWKPFEQRFHPEWVIDPWDRAVLGVDRYTLRDLGIGLVERIGIHAIWDERGSQVIAIGVEGLAHFAFEGATAGSQVVDVQVDLPRGVEARNLPSAVENAFPRGLSVEVELDRGLLPRETRAGTFVLELDLDTLMEMAEGR